jgi:hypothetical protein
MVIRLRQARMSSRSRGSVFSLELIAAIGILGLVLMPLGAGLAQSNRACRSAYYHAIAMELVDGELEALAGGELKEFPPGIHVYDARGASSSNLPPGRFELTIDQDRVRLSWIPESRLHERPVTRELAIGHAIADPASGRGPKSVALPDADPLRPRNKDPQ